MSKLILRVDERTAPEFIGRFNLPDFSPPIRAYLHKLGFKVFMEKGGTGSASTDAYSFLIDAVTASKLKERNLDYVLAVLWADEKSRTRAVDFYGYSGIAGWPGNPDMEPLWAMKEGSLSPLKGCGDTQIILGLEEQWRRECNKLEDYLWYPPPIEGLNLEFEH